MGAHSEVRRPGAASDSCCWAALNAGENGLIPELDEIWMPPPPLGSGKFGTPCVRMHFENLMNAVLAPGDAEPDAL